MEEYQKLLKIAAQKALDCGDYDFVKRIMNCLENDTNVVGINTKPKYQPYSIESIELCCNLRQVEGWTYEDIAAELKRLGHKTLRGCDFHPNTVRNIVQKHTRKTA